MHKYKGNVHYVFFFERRSSGKLKNDLFVDII